MLALIRPDRRSTLGAFWAEDPLATAADELDAQVGQRLDSVRERLGVRALRHPRVLHQLGEVVVLADAGRAAALRALVENTNSARASATLFLQEAKHLVSHCATPLPDEALVYRVAEGVYAERTP
jgi:hypothetical protein